MTMGLVNFIISTVGRCLDAVCFLLDLNFLVVHSVVKTLLAVIAFITNLPTLLLSSILQLGDLTVFCLVSTAESAVNLAHGSVSLLGRLLLALEGLLESLKMVGYLSMHVGLRGKDQLYRGLLTVVEGCGIAVSLVVYFTNTVVNYALITAQNIYLAAVSVWQMVSSPLQKVLELTLTTFTFLYSSLVGTSALLMSPCKLVLDFVVSLIHMFISIFILNIYGLLLTVTIALATTIYLNPDLVREVSDRIVDYILSVPALRRLFINIGRRMLALQVIPQFFTQRLPRVLYHLYRLERRLWQQLSRLSSQISQALRGQLHRHDNNREQGDGDPAEERRDPPDGRAGEGVHQDVVSPSSSTERPLKRRASPGEEGKDAEDLLALLKEQEERKKCVICQDCTKTVVLLPCRHLCLCRECTTLLLRQPLYQHNCPLCRRMILDTMDVYL